MEITKNRFPGIGVFSIVGLIAVILSWMFRTSSTGIFLLVGAALILAPTVAYEEKKNPKCSTWEKVIYYVLIALFIFSVAAALQPGMPLRTK